MSGSREPLFYDISMVLRPGVPEWPGDAPYTCGWTMRMDAGAHLNLSHFAMSPHVGTHADAPLHVLDGGDASESFPLDVFRGRAFVLDLPEALRLRAHAAAAALEIADIAPHVPRGVERLLVKTGRSTASGEFPAAWAALTPSCVAALCAGGLRLLGVDAPSVDAREAKVLATHRALFEGRAYNLENLDLTAVPGGHYDLVAYPLRLAGLDAAPVRAVLAATG